MRFSHILLRFTLHPFCHFIEIFHAIFDFHFIKLIMHSALNLFSTELVLGDWERCIGDDEGDDYFKSYDEVLDQNGS